MARTKSSSCAPSLWTVADSVDTYKVDRWGDGYFRIGENGNVTVTPRGEQGPAVDMKGMVDDLRRRGIELPLLLRFSDILEDRIELLNSAFGAAIREYDYEGCYRGVYPIKVNQTRRVVEEVIRFGQPHHYGLEAGSKPELLAVVALHKDPEALIICNGYKDADYIETALLASRLGRKVVLVVEKPSELDEIHRVSGALNIAPVLGLRARLAARGAGRWEQSGGDRSKFGLSAGEMLAAVDKLHARHDLDQLELLHFHLGSQISSIRSIKNALREAARVYCGIRQLGCDKLGYFDVGGGLGVDYDGSRSSFGSSINYSVQEYANDVVFAVQEVCDETSVPHPTIVSESGRAIMAHTSVLVLDVLGVGEIKTAELSEPAPADDAQVLRNLQDCHDGIGLKNLREYYHDALEFRDHALQLFNLGHLDMRQRVAAERLFWDICGKAADILGELSHVPKDMKRLERMLSDTYFCNFSMFQSLPDLWAIDQQFPIMPLHRLAEEPTRRAVLADMTCDSDGTINSFIDPRDVKHTLELHPFRESEPYHLGVFLVGAYQEILGDLHNLFGDTNVVHVSIDDDGSYTVDELIEGDTVADVLAYVGYSAEHLTRRLHQNIETALKVGSISHEQSRQLRQQFGRGLSGYTYLGARD